MALLKWWKEIVLVLVVIGVLGYWHHLTSTIDKQKTQLAEQKSQISLLSSAIEKQNAAVEQMKIDSEARIKAGELAQKQAETRASANKKRAADLANALAKYPADLCRSANELIDGELK